MLNKAKHKTRCRCMRREKQRKRSSHGDNTNVLTKEFKAFTVKRFGKQVSLLIIGVNKLKSESTIFDKLPNEVMSNLYVFGSRMLNRILSDVKSLYSISFTCRGISQKYFFITSRIKFFHILPIL